MGSPQVPCWSVSPVCIRPRLRPYNFHGKLSWRFELKFGWVQSEDSEDEYDGDGWYEGPRVLGMPDDDVLLTLACLRSDRHM